MARDVTDCAIMIEAMAGFDPKDATSLDLPVPEWSANLSSDMRGKRVGIPREYRVEGMDPVIDALWQQGVAWVKDAGAEVVEISLPQIGRATSELQSLMRISYAVFCFKKNTN